MQLDLTAQDHAFRDEVRAFLDAELTPELRRAGTLMTSVYARPEVGLAWQRRLHARGWAAPAWPIQHGGCDWSPGQRWIFAEELADAGAPPLSPMGLGMIGPVLIAHGSAEQQARFLPRILSGEEFWCQGYSEPDSGSDLASLSMQAVDDGDHLVCTGHKLWTTYAHAANWIFCLVRTSREAAPQRGITFLLIDMTSPGVTVRPSLSLSGEHIQNHVIFDAVRVPKANVVGAIGEGWTVAKALLEFERGGAVRAPSLKARIRALAQALPADSPDLRSQLAAVAADTDTLEALELRQLAGLDPGRSPGADAPMMKVLVTEIAQRLTEIALCAAGPYGAVYQPGAVCPGGDAPGGLQGEGLGPEPLRPASLRYLNDRAATIYGGTNEIQRNILARTLLGR